MVVYLVTSGEYSDFGVEGIFSTEEKAQAYIDGVKGCKYNDFNEIEPIEVDEWVGATVGPRWAVGIDLPTGEIDQPRERDSQVIHADRRCTVSGPYGRPPHRLIIDSPVSAEHAVKVAVEKRQEWLRNTDRQGVTES